MPWPPVARGPVGIRRPWGTKSERIRFQSRGWPAGPEITSYSAATMASIDDTSSGLACGTAMTRGCCAGCGGCACCAGFCCAASGPAAKTATAETASTADALRRMRGSPGRGGVENEPARKHTHPRPSPTDPNVQGTGYRLQVTASVSHVRTLALSLARRRSPGRRSGRRAAARTASAGRRGTVAQRRRHAGEAVEPRALVGVQVRRQAGAQGVEPGAERGVGRADDLLVARVRLLDRRADQGALRVVARADHLFHVLREA